MSIFKKAGLGALATLIIWVGGFVVFTACAVLAKPQHVDETTDAIVVLTGGNNRVEEGLELFANGRATHLFITGVFEDVTKQEILSLWKGGHALPPCCVTLGYEATTTVQNAAETREWIQKQDYNSIRLVTGNYHMWRSVMEFKHALPGIDIYTNPVWQPGLGMDARHFWELLFTEYHKCLYRRVQLLFTPRPKLEENA